jgi:hypothetical protein
MTDHTTEQKIDQEGKYYGSKKKTKSKRKHFYAGAQYHELCAFIGNNVELTDKLIKFTKHRYTVTITKHIEE